jgi:hypothetical protein
MGELQAIEKQDAGAKALKCSIVLVGTTEVVP